MKENNPWIEIRDLQKVYFRRNAASIKALDGISLKVFQGEFLAIIGRSGSGKTTLLNLIGTLDHPTSGEVRLEGKILSNLSNRELAIVRREKIGFIFQTFNLLPALTVFENVELALIHSRMSEDRMKSKISTMLDALALSEMSYRLPLELSVGQRQKVAIARALIKDPAVILADEPTGEMDPITSREILEKLIELNRKSKITLIVASHGSSVLSEASRALFIKNGKIVSQSDAGY
jgi:putative ABC transport system ATP-binding protein